MKVINAWSVNEALAEGIYLINTEGEELNSRAGTTLEIPEPVTTVYHCPLDRVLINKERDANPFFHMMESIWILAGRDDVPFLTEFNKRMGEYSDNGRVFNAPYGYRLRTGVGAKQDQLIEIIDILKRDPNSRQAVAQIWDDYDLTKTTKDKACNMLLVFRIRKGYLDLTVYNRSNDMIWGAYGANVVQFSTILEYVAAHMGIDIGTYTQVSNSYHVYTTGAGGAIWDKMRSAMIDTDPYYDISERVYMHNSSMALFDSDMEVFFDTYDREGRETLGVLNNWGSDYFNKLVIPMLRVYNIHKSAGSTEH